MKNLKIGLRLGIGFAVVLLLLLAIAVIGSMRLNALQAEITDLVGDKNFKVATSNDRCGWATCCPASGPPTTRAEKWRVIP